MDLAISKRKGEKESIFVLYRTQNLCYIKQNDTIINLSNLDRDRGNLKNQISSFFKDLDKEETLKSFFYGEIGRGKKYSDYLMMIILDIDKKDLNFLVSLKSILGLEKEIILEKINRHGLANNIGRIDEEGRRKILNFFKILVKKGLLTETDKMDLYKSFLISSKGIPKIDFLNCCLVRWLINNKTELAINLTEKMYENEHFLISYEYSYIKPEREEMIKKLFDAKYNNYNALINFFVFQPKIQGFITFHNFLTEYLDYLHLQMLYYEEIRDKYPQNILSDNQRISTKYNEMKEIIDKKRFAKASEKQKEYEGSIGEYIFISPKIPGDMVDEARQQNNCLKSYIQSFLNEKTNIFFLRRKEEPEKSLITIEVCDGKLMQAYLAYNKKPGKEQKDIIQKWCNIHNIVNNIFVV